MSPLPHRQDLWIQRNQKLYLAGDLRKLMFIFFCLHYQSPESTEVREGFVHTASALEMLQSSDRVFCLHEHHLWSLHTTLVSDRQSQNLLRWNFYPWTPWDQNRECNSHFKQLKSHLFSTNQSRLLSYGTSKPAPSVPWGTFGIAFHESCSHIRARSWHFTAS